MWKLILVLGLFFVCTPSVSAQVPLPTPIPLPSGGPPRGRDRTVSTSSQSSTAIDQAAVMTGALVPLEMPPELLFRQQVIQKYVDPLYRKPTNAEVRFLAPDKELMTQFSEFLSLPNTGLFKLVVDKHCGPDINLSSAAPECLKLTMPGGGSSFSFRMDMYRISHLADLTYTANTFQAPGVLAHGIFAKIGDVPLESVSTMTPGIGYLTDFGLPKDFKDAAEIESRLANGIKKDGFVYARAVPAVENTTYLLRSIAYHGKSYHAIRGVSFNAIDFDKRKDVIVAFRVVGREADGSLNILWKLIMEKDSPWILSDDKP